MIRKMLVLAAAVAMPAAAMAGASAVTGAGIASAKALPPVATTCTLTGSVTFAAPGLALNGALGKKATVSSSSALTASGTGCGAGTSGSTAVKSKIVSTATDCLTAPAPAPAGCALATSKVHYLYDTTGSLATSGVPGIVASLSKGIKLADNGNKVTGTVTLAGTAAVVGGACGYDTSAITPTFPLGTPNIGFSISGNTNVTGLTYSVVLCITGDTGTSTTNHFSVDYLAAAGGNAGIQIATGTFGGASSLTFTKV